MSKLLVSRRTSPMCFRAAAAALAAGIFLLLSVPGQESAGGRPRENAARHLLHPMQAQGAAGFAPIIDSIHIVAFTAPSVADHMRAGQLLQAS